VLAGGFDFSVFANPFVWFCGLASVMLMPMAFGGHGSVRPSVPLLIGIVGQSFDTGFAVVLLAAALDVLQPAPSWRNTVRVRTSSVTIASYLLVAAALVRAVWPGSWDTNLRIVVEAAAASATELLMLATLMALLVRLGVGPTFRWKPFVITVAPQSLTQALVEFPIVALAVIAMKVAPWSVLLLAVPLTLVYFVVRQSVRLHGALTELSTDSLTGVLSRAGFEQAAGGLLAANDRGPDTAVFMCDVDDFKIANDTHGHLVGDEMLVAVGAALRDAAAMFDGIVGRLGGEEFVVLAQLPPVEAVAAADRLRRAVSESLVVWGNTISVGTAMVRDDERLIDAVGRADEAMYRAKRAGKDRVASAPALRLAA